MTKQQPTSSPKAQGFSLIELMIVVAVMGILVVIAVPNYQRYTQDARRADAQAVMLNYVARLERNLSINSSYLVGGVAPALPANPEGYTLSFPAATPVTATTFVLSAAPVAGGPQATDRCGTMTISNTGARTADEANCWR
ncbi:type IV pilin protein [Salinispirillum marinum]|uniref:type IV pilin protein n=1 Tax=Salinispirillum marinum TaxID=1485203 RepID=UPI0036D25121